MLKCWGPEPLWTTLSDEKGHFPPFPLCSLLWDQYQVGDIYISDKQWVMKPQSAGIQVSLSLLLSHRLKPTASLGSAYSVWDWPSVSDIVVSEPNLWSITEIDIYGSGQLVRYVLHSIFINKIQVCLLREW